MNCDAWAIGLDLKYRIITPNRVNSTDAAAMVAPYDRRLLEGVSNSMA